MMTDSSAKVTSGITATSSSAITSSMDSGLLARPRLIRLIWRRHRKVQKNLVVFDTDLKTRFGRFLLANSITLTPGTITVRVEENRFTVHCMSRDMIDGINDGALVKLIRKMEA